LPIEISDILNLNNRGFNRDVYPAFNVSENIFSHKSQYTKDLYLTLTDTEPRRIFFRDGILRGKIINETNGDLSEYVGGIDFLVSEFEGNATWHNKKEGKSVPVGKYDLNGYIIFNLNYVLFEKLGVLDEIEWLETQKFKDMDPKELVEWDVEDEKNKLEIDEEEEFIIDTLYGMLENYVDDSEKVKEIYKKSYLIGVAKSLKITIESLKTGGIRKGIDAVSNFYQRNCKETFEELKNINNFNEDYYVCAGMLWGYREAIEYVGGFPEVWQHKLRAENGTTTIDELDVLAERYPEEINIRDDDDNFYMMTGICIGIIGTFVGNILSHRYIFNNNRN